MDDSSSVAVSSASPDAAVASPSTKPPAKKKRNLPGMPDPDAEVIALSPKTLLATNRFVCEICSKGFQRDQNLQLHRRGHNLPWKLKQRTGGKDQVRKRVYVCPEPNCVHHNPDRALGDLTGIKKHFCRKHGEKKWKCERCSKKYAVQSDWKAHMKTCGTKEYKCDCGTVFSRRDSFITHRAFCDALAEESSRTLGQPAAGNPSHAKAASSPPQPPPPPPLTPTTTVVSPVLSIQSSDLPENATELLPPSPAVAAPTTALAAAAGAATSNESGGGFGGVYSAPTQLLAPPLLPQSSPSSLSNMVCPVVPSDQGGSLPSPSTTEPTSLSLFLSSTASSIFSRPEQNPRLYAPSVQPAMSATALLQKAAQMGAAASNTSLLRDLGLAMPSTSYSNDNAAAASTSTAAHWGPKAENTDPTGHVLGLGLTPQESSGIPGLMMGGPSSMFSTKPTTLDFLGLGMGLGGATNGGLSAFLTTLESSFTAAPPASSGGGGRQSSG